MALASLAVVLPLVAAAVLAGTTSWRARRVADVVALSAAATVMGLCVALVARSCDETIVAWMGGWRPRHGIAVGIGLIADPLSAGLAAFAAFLTVAALSVAWHQVDTAGHLFHALVLSFLAGMAGFCLSGDLFTAFVFFELMSVSAYALAGFRVEERAPLEGSLSFAITNSVGSLLLLIGIALVYGRTGALNLAQIGAALGDRTPDTLVAVAFALIACGFFVKAAIVPFHFWMADAYAVAPTSISLLFAGAMSEIGIYGLARVYWSAFDGALGPHAGTLRDVLIVLGVATALVGGVMCAGQRHLKRLLAFATVAHMGILLCGVALLDRDGVAGVAVFVIGDGLVKASLFVAVGALEHRRGSVDEVALYGRGRDMRALGAVFAVAGLALAALPPFGPFLGRAMIEDGATGAGLGWVPPLLVVASALVGGAVLRVVRTVFLGRGPVPPEHPACREVGAGDELEDDPGTPVATIATGTVLLVAGLAWGVIPGLVDSATTAAARFTDHAGYAGVVLRGVQHATAGAAGHPPTAAAWLYGAASCLLAVVVAAVRTIPEGPLRPLHSGRIGDYVAWATVGAATVAVAFAITIA